MRKLFPVIEKSVSFKNPAEPSGSWIATFKEIVSTLFKTAEVDRGAISVPNPILKKSPPPKLILISTELENLGFTLKAFLPKDIRLSRHKVKVYEAHDWTPASSIKVEQQCKEKEMAPSYYSYARPPIDPDQNVLDSLSEISAAAEHDNPIDVLLARFPALKQLVQELIINTQLMSAGMISEEFKPIAQIKLYNSGNTAIGFDLNNHFTMAVFSDYSKRNLEVGVYEKKQRGLTPVVVAEVRYLVSGDLEGGRTRMLGAYGRSQDFDPRLAEILAHRARYDAL